jgi:hypothetical protein
VSSLESQVASTASRLAQAQALPRAAAKGAEAEVAALQAMNAYVTRLATQRWGRFATAFAQTPC